MCVAKAQGDVAEAVARLHDYLKLFQADATAVRQREPGLVALL